MTTSEKISLFFSAVAIIISVYAIVSQNKGVVFEHRLSIYIKVCKIYNQCQRILEICPGKRAEVQKRLIATVLFEIKSDKLKISHKFIQSFGEETDVLTQKQAKLLDKYANYYIRDHLNESLNQECDIFFDPKIYSHVQKLYAEYDNLLLGFLTFTEDDLTNEYKSLEVILSEFRRDKILSKMKRKLPIC